LPHSRRVPLKHRMYIRPKAGQGYGFGALPAGLDVIAVIVLAAASQMSSSWYGVAIHAAASIFLLGLNLTLPFPRIFIWSTILTVIPIFLGNLAFPSGGLELSFDSSLEGASFYAIRRASSLFYGFAWLFSSNPARFAVTAHTFISRLSDDKALLCTLLVGTFPRMTRAYRELRISIALRTRRSAHPQKSRPSLFRSLNDRLSMRLSDLYLVAIGSVLRFGSMISDISSAFHSFAPRKTRDALPPLKHYIARIRSLRMGSVRFAGDLKILGGPGHAICLTGDDAALVSAVLSFCARIVPTLEGKATGRLSWNGSDLLAARAPLAETQGRMCHLSPMHGTAGLGVTVEQHLELSGVAPDEIMSVARSWGLAPLLQNPLENLSGGQRRRCLLSACLHSKAEVLTLDEPFAELDREGRDVLHRALTQRVKDGHGLLLISDSTGTFRTRSTIVAESVKSPHREFRAPRFKSPQTSLLLGPIEAIEIPGRNLQLTLSPSFAIAAGRLVALTGSNGSGKSSLLDALVGILPSSLSAACAPSDIGYVMQDPDANWAGLKVRDEISIGSQQTRSWLNPRAREVGLYLARYLRPLDRKIVSELTPFQKRILSFYCMARGARIILCDEPDAYLSRSEKAAIASLLKSFANAGYAVVAATHSHDIIRCADAEARLVRANDRHALSS
jgi:energy-coupling factor transporter ATP-binding protein EcfA2